MHRALRNGQENNVHIPYTVISELDKLKRDPRIEHIVSQAVKSILKDDQMNILAPEFAEKLGDLNPDDRILQIKAGSYNLTCEEYKDSDPFRSDSQMYTGLRCPPQPSSLSKSFNKLRT